MAWVSARERMGHTSNQTGVAVSVTDGRGEPPERDKVILETVILEILERDKVI